MRSDEPTNLSGYWTNTLWNLLDALRGYSPSLTSAKYDLIGLAIWLRFQGFDSQSQVTDASNPANSIETLKSANPLEVRDLFQQTLIDCTQPQSKRRQAIEFIAQSSLRSLSGPEISAVISTVSSYHLQDDAKTRDAIGDAYRYLLSRVGPERLEHWSPVPLSRLVARLGRPSAADRIYDPYSGSGGFLIEAWKLARGTTQSPRGFEPGGLWGTEINVESWARSILIFDLYGIEAELECADTYSYVAHRLDPTLILSDPPLNEGPAKSSLSHVASPYETSPIPESVKRHFRGVYKILDDLKGSNGRAVMVLPTRVLFGAGSVARARGEWIQADLMEAVVSLPKGLFMPLTNLGLGIGVFNLSKPPARRGKVLLIDAESLGRSDKSNRFSLEAFDEQAQRVVEAFETYSESPGFSVTVDVANLESNGWNLTPGRYLQSAPTQDSAPDIQSLFEMTIALDEAAALCQAKFMSAAVHLSNKLHHS